ncbi:MAG: Ldh family oxidoreductase [Dehalococcoidia bacterium]|jgi:LDH2 family malate/lactate/ureidoglycolate dehydrogenase|nr:Ldh family oxidoreductase [Dehalococcoidia bacterium]
MLERFKVPEADRVYVSVEEMRPATESIFRALGVSDEDAVQATDVLMMNDLRGVESHGVSNMLRVYVAWYRSGRLQAQPEFTIEQETETTATIDGGQGLGLHVAPRAMRMAIEKAREHGMGAVGVHAVGHMGGAGYHAMMAMEHDMIGIAMSSSGSNQMVPTFGAEPRLGTNPMAWAVPAGRMPPFVFDVGTTQVAANKMSLARRVGAKIAPGWVSDEHGTPLMEEGDVPEKYFLLPLGSTRELGSHKGYGLATVVDILCSVLVGLGPGFKAMEPGFHMMALRIDAFTDLAQFKSHMDELLEGLATTPPAPGHERVLYAGQLEAEETELRLAEGIPYHSEVIEWFRGIEAELGLDFSFT